MKVFTAAILAGGLSGCRTAQTSGEKETLVFQNIEPKQALERMNSNGGYRYVDVRTPEEFAEGHAAGAVNIPVSYRDPASGQLVPNPEFLKTMQVNFDHETPLILGCRSGGRSARAAKVLGDTGFKHVYNLQGGYIGAYDPTGHCTTPGWTMLGLPNCRNSVHGPDCGSLTSGH